MISHHEENLVQVALPEYFPDPDVRAEEVIPLFSLVLYKKKTRLNN